MNTAATEDLRYPIGKFNYAGPYDAAQRDALITELEQAPLRLRHAVRGLSEEQLDTPYRPGGWTVRQVVHHLPDSHLNAYIRFKLALTENEPAIKPYDEARWAETPEIARTPAAVSLDVLDGLHRRFAILLRNMTAEDFQRAFHHPERGRLVLDQYLGMYAWHGKHHVAHITSLRKRKGW